MAKKKSRRPGIPEHDPTTVVATTPTPSLTLAESVEKIVAQNPGPEEAKEILDSASDLETSPTATQSTTARCEAAKEVGACACRCRGRYHGKPHPDGWKDEEGCHPLSKEERKMAKKDTLNAWRRAHPDRVAAYMKGWRETSDAPTAQAARAAAARKELSPIEATPGAVHSDVAQ